ncbi:restless-like transposase [Apiospora arundinis]|uniref:Restless-like transposase n=1 Tax=Apiospora arundinis TaxID=335852 RepID=A0ABR2IWN0_9PEZI
MLLPIEPIAVAESPVLATALEVEPEPVAILPAWPLTLEAEVRLFRQWKGYSLAQRTSQTQSWIWSFGIEIQDSTSRRWVCGPCLTAKVPKPTSYISEGTQNCEKHLWEKHGRWDTSGKRPKPSNKRGSKRKHGNIAGFMNLDLADPKDQAVANRLIKGFDRSHFQRLIVNWIVDSQLSFRAVENPRLRAVFEYLNPAVTIQQAHISRHTLRRRTIELYNIHLFTVKKALRQCPGQIHLAFDGARTRNRHALFEITAAYRDVNNNPQKVVLGAPEVVDRHTGDNIAAEIIDVIRTYGIEDKVGYFTLDNATNNDAAMEAIGKELGFSALERRVRCIGHVINLVVKALLFGSDAEAFEDTVVEGELLARASHVAWMKKGPVGKAHNFVVWVNRSDIFTQMLRKIQKEHADQATDRADKERKPLDVVLDNDTRWLSQYYMIQRMLVLRPYYDEFILKAKKYCTDTKVARIPFCLEKSSIIDDNDWAVMEAFADLLQHFHVIVKVLQGDGQARYRAGGISEAYGLMPSVMQSFEYLLKKLETAKELIHQYPEPEQFGINVNLGWIKLDKYYATLSDTPVYYAAAALDPGIQWTFFETIWTENPSWANEAKAKVQALWDNEYRDLELTRGPSQEGPIAKRRKTYHTGFDDFQDECRSQLMPRIAPSLTDEYTRWVMGRTTTKAWLIPLRTGSQSSTSIPGCLGWR